MYNSSHRNPYTHGSTCITYDAVNAAYLDARKRISMFLPSFEETKTLIWVVSILQGVHYPKGDWKTEDIASVGELILDISIQLARQ